MSRTQFPLYIQDISALARRLASESKNTDQSPHSHVEWLNILAKSAGFRNFQHFRADHAAAERLSKPQVKTDDVDHRLLEQAIRHLDSQGRLVRWPAKFSHRNLCLWWLWALIPSRTCLTEPQVNSYLKAACLFEDYVTIRRALIDANLLVRTTDGSSYQRREQPPTSTVSAFIRQIAQNRGDDKD